MKNVIVFCKETNPDGPLFTPRVSESKIDYVLDSSLPIKTHIDKLCQVFNISEVEFEKYTLQLKVSAQYIEQDDELKSLMNEGTELNLRILPSIRATKAVECLKDETNTVAKEAAFAMRFELKDETFAEDFIEAGGMPAIIKLATNTKGNVQAYALTALRAAMVYVSGMDVVIETEDLMVDLYKLVGSTLVAVSRQTLELLFVMCNYGNNGWKHIHKAVKETAKEKQIKPYEDLISLLSSGDLDTQVNCLTLLNSLLSAASPDQLKAKKLIEKWKALNLDSLLVTFLDTTKHQAFITQIKLYQVIINY